MTVQLYDGNSAAISTTSTTAVFGAPLLQLVFRCCGPPWRPTTQRSKHHAPKHQLGTDQHRGTANLREGRAAAGGAPATRRCRVPPCTRRVRYRGTG